MIPLVARGMKIFQETAFRDLLNVFISEHNDLVTRVDELEQADSQVFLPSGQIGFIPVQLTEDGGTEGSCSEPCSFTYTVASLQGIELGMALSPEWRPQSPGRLTSGDGLVGQAYYNADGDLVLYMAAESVNFDCECCGDNPCAQCAGPQGILSISGAGTEFCDGGSGLYPFVGFFHPVPGFVCTWSYMFGGACTGNEGIYIKYCHTTGTDPQSGQAVVAGTWYIFYLSTVGACWKETTAFTCVGGTVSGTDTIEAADLISGSMPAGTITITL